MDDVWLSFWFMSGSGAILLLSCACRYFYRRGFDDGRRAQQEYQYREQAARAARRSAARSQKIQEDIARWNKRRTEGA